MQLSEARGFAAQCWTEPKNSRKVMDTDLAESFARMLVARTDEAVTASRISQARKVMRDALEDAGLRQAYIANVSMLIHDRLGYFDHVKRDEVADRILELLFGEKCRGSDPGDDPDYVGA